MVEAIVHHKKPRASGEKREIECSLCCFLLVLLLLIFGSIVWHLWEKRSAWSSSSASPPSPGPTTSVSPSPSSPSISSPLSHSPSVLTRPISKPTELRTNIDDTNFTIDALRDGSEIRICVRNRSCEDGGHISVSFNGCEVFLGEIYAVPMCVVTGPFPARMACYCMPSTAPSAKEIAATSPSTPRKLLFNAKLPKVFDNFAYQLAALHVQTPVDINQSETKLQ